MTPDFRIQTPYRRAGEPQRELVDMNPAALDDFLQRMASRGVDRIVMSQEHHALLCRMCETERGIPVRVRVMYGVTIDIKE